MLSAIDKNAIRKEVDPSEMDFKEPARDLDDLCASHYRPLFGFALSLTRDRTRAEDVVQETFVRALAHQELLFLLSPPQQKAWLMKVARNLFLDLVRRPELGRGLEEEPSWEMPETPGLEFETMISGLSGKLQEVVRLKYQGGMNSAEIALRLGIPAGTARTRLHLAIRNLRKTTKTDQEDLSWNGK